MMEKVGVYCRLSDEDRNKIHKNDDSESIVNQKSMCIKYALTNNWEVIDIYVDDDLSGAGVNRPDFNRLIEDCKNGKINLVLCKSQSRFTREIEDVEYYLHKKFLEWNVRFVSIVDNADTSDDYNKKSRQINGLMNEWYLDDLSRNIKKSLKNKREDGLFMGSFAPYGYDRDKEDKHKLVIDPIASKIVKEIFGKYASGLGYYKIAEYLNNNKVPTPSAYKKQSGSKFVCYNAKTKASKWNMDSIAKILRNEVYIGNLVQGKKTSLGYKVHKFKSVNKKDWCRVENTHEPIISRNIWNMVSIRLGTHERPTKTNGEVHYLSKKVYCIECGKVFISNSSKSAGSKDGIYHYLNCKSGKRYNACDNKRGIRYDELENILLNAINEMIDNYYDNDNLQKELSKIKSKKNKLNETILILTKERSNNIMIIDENRSYFKNLYEDKIKKVIDEDMFKMLTSDYTKIIDEKILRNEKIDEEINLLENEKQNKIDANVLLKKYKKIDKLNKIIVDEFIDKVNIGILDNETKQRNIEIIWNFEI